MHRDTCTRPLSFMPPTASSLTPQHFTGLMQVSCWNTEFCCQKHQAAVILRSRRARNMKQQRSTKWTDSLHHTLGFGSRSWKTSLSHMCRNNQPTLFAAVSLGDESYRCGSCRSIPSICIQMSVGGGCVCLMLLGFIWKLRQLV